MKTMEDLLCELQEIHGMLTEADDEETARLSGRVFELFDEIEGCRYNLEILLNAPITSGPH